MGKTLNDILEVASSYITSEESLNIIRKAHEIAVKMHEGQFRKSGDPYVQHPIEVAYILATMDTGPVTIAAGLLHDVLEDTDMTKEQMEEMFGQEVTQIVDGVTKISKLKYMTKEEVNYLIDRQYKPEEFLNYFGIEGFTIYKLDWYNHAKNIENYQVFLSII